MAEYTLIFLMLGALAAAFYFAWERFVKPPPKSDSELYVAALRDLLDGRPEKAFAGLRQVVAEDSSNIDAYLRLGQILRQSNKADRALQVHRDLTLRSDLTANEKAAVLAQLAEDYAALDDLETAIAALDELKSLQSGNRQALTRLLELQKQAGQWDGAYDTAVAIIKLDSGKSKKSLARYKFQQGLQLFNKREQHKARVVFKEAIGLDPEFVPAYLTIGDSYCLEERFEDAVNFWNKLIAAVPEEGHQVIDRLKKALFDLGRFGEIGEICRNILAHAPQNVEARMMLAEFYQKKGELAPARDLLNEVVEDNPDDMRAVLELVRVYLEGNETRKITDLLGRLEKRWETKKADSPDRATETGVPGV